MKKSIIIITTITAGLFSCGQTIESKPENADTGKANSVTSIQNSNNIYNQYEYSDPDGKSIIIQNSYPKGGSKYTDAEGKLYTYAIFWSRIINETDHPIELKLNVPGDSLELASIPGQYFRMLLHPDSMTTDKETLSLYGLKDVASFLHHNADQSSPQHRTIHPGESGGFYFVKLNIMPQSGWRGKGATRAELSLRGQNIYYKVKNDGSNSNSESSEIEILCGTIHLKDLRLKK